MSAAAALLSTSGVAGAVGSAGVAGRSLAAADPNSGSALWYLNRATGVVSLLLLTGVVVLGVLVRQGSTVSGRLPRFVLSGLHRNLALLSLAFLAIHVVASVTDSFAPIRLIDAVVPFVSEYRPVWLGLGTVGLDLLVAVVLTSLLRRSIGRRMWRTVHWGAFAAWPVALVHGLGTGTDTGEGWLLALTVGCVVVALAAVAWRLVRVPDPHATIARTVAVVLAVGLPLALLGWLRTGPLGPNWAARAGTPASLLAGSTGSGDGNGADDRPTGVAQVSGTISERQTGDGITLVLSGDLSGGPGGQLRIVLRGQLTGGGVGTDGDVDGQSGSDSDGQVAVNSGALTLSPAAGGDYSGNLGTISGERLTATLDGPAGQVTLDVQLVLRDTTFTGTVGIR